MTKQRMSGKREQIDTRGCVYYVQTPDGYVGMVASREQARQLDQHSVLVCDEKEVANFPTWGNEKANQYVVEKALSVGFRRKGESAFFERVAVGDGYVYFIEAVGLKRLKIGYSDDPDKRVRTLATGSPVSLRVLAKMPGTQAMEKEIHAKFAHLKVENEWFHLTDDIRAYIDKNCV